MTDVTSCLCRGKADTPQIHKNTLYNPTHLESSKARIFLTKKPAVSGLRTVGLLKTDEASFQLNHSLPSRGRQPPLTGTVSLPQSAVSTFPRPRQVWRLRSSCSAPASSPSPAPGPSNHPGSSYVSSDSQQGRKQKTVQLNYLFHLKCPF